MLCTELHLQPGALFFFFLGGRGPFFVWTETSAIPSPRGLMHLASLGLVSVRDHVSQFLLINPVLHAPLLYLHPVVLPFLEHGGAGCGPRVSLVLAAASEEDVPGLTVTDTKDHAAEWGRLLSPSLVGLGRLGLCRLGDPVWGSGCPEKQGSGLLTGLPR